MGKYIRNGEVMFGTSDKSENISYGNGTVKTALDGLNDQLSGVRFGIDGDGNRGYYEADDSFVPFSSGVVSIPILFENGVEKVKFDLSGFSSNIGVVSFRDATKSGNNIEASSSSSNVYSCFATEDRVDLKGVSKLRLYGTISKSGTYAGNALEILSKRQYINTNVRISIPLPNISNSYTDIDVSMYDGCYYLGFMASNAVSNITLNKIECIK